MNNTKICFVGNYKDGYGFYSTVIKVGTKLVPFKRTSKNASFFEVSEAEVKTLPPKSETPKANSDLQLTILAVRAMAESGLQYAEIDKVIGKDENTVVALMKVAEAFK